MKILSLSSLFTLLTICSLSAQNPTLPPPPNEPPLQVPVASDDLIPPLPETATPTPAPQAVPKTPPAVAPVNPIPVPDRQIPSPSQLKSTTPPQPQSNQEWSASPEFAPRSRYGTPSRQPDAVYPAYNLDGGAIDPRHAPHYQPMYNTYDPHAARYYGAHSWSQPMSGDGINPEGAEGIFVGPAFSGGLHVRFPYYSYRRPWYTRGAASLNVDIIW